MKTGDRNFILRPPKRPKGPPKSENELGRRRRLLIESWTEHVLGEHHWSQKYTDTPADPEGQRDCVDCADYLSKIKESEQWT